MKPIEMWCCETAFEHEMGFDAEGTVLYPSKTCWGEKCECSKGTEFPCTAVKVLVTRVEE